MSMKIREARPEDAAACGEICFDAFKAVSENHNFIPDFPSIDASTGLLAHLISRNDVYTIVAEADSRVIGSNALWENGDIAGVGPITVDPEAQQRSVGRRLMEAVIERANGRGFLGVRLVQAAFNNLTMALYTKLGFEVREPLSVMQGPAMKLQMPGLDVRPATPEDEDACNALCHRVHGHRRQGDVADAIQQRTATVVERDGRVTGYATVIGFFGHTVGENNDDLKALIGAAPAFAGPGILVPTRNAELLRWCMRNGLRIDQPMSLMSHGLYNEPAGSFLPSVIF